MTGVIRISAADEVEFSWCAEIMAGTDPWLTYKFSPDTCAKILRWPGSTLFVARTDRPAGFTLLHPRGFLGSPYLAVVAVAPELRGRGIGTKLLEYADAYFSRSRHLYLCVSSFNVRARRLYERYGYSKVGELPDFVADGYSEFLMQKHLP